jgi:hypothetical protein
MRDAHVDWRGGGSVVGFSGFAMGDVRFDDR